MRTSLANNKSAQAHLGLCCALTFAIMAAFSTGCRTFQLDQSIDRLADRWTASNNRDWAPEMAVLPTADVNGLQYVLHNIRNCQYLTAEDFVVNHYDRTIDLSQIQSVDYIVVPFNETSALAHTMLSFEINDGTYVGMSVEVRKERNEKYSPVLGLGRKFELMYVMADERDLIRLRAQHRNSEVFVYPTVATPQQSQQLFAQIVNRMNKLAAQPEFYNSLTNNCTTNIKQHVNELAPNKVAFNWQILLPGFSARYAYDRGLLDQRIPFEDLTTVASVTKLAVQHQDSPRFSQRIRSDRYMIDRYAARQVQRSPTINGRGDQLLQSIKNESRWR